VQSELERSGSTLLFNRGHFAKDPCDISWNGRPPARPARHRDVLYAVHGHGRAHAGSETETKRGRRMYSRQPGPQHLSHHLDQHDDVGGAASAVAHLLGSGRARLPSSGASKPGHRPREIDGFIARAASPMARHSTGAGPGISRHRADAGYRARLRGAGTKGLRFAVLRASDRLALGCMAERPTRLAMQGRHRLRGLRRPGMGLCFSRPSRPPCARRRRGSPTRSETSSKPGRTDLALPAARNSTQACPATVSVGTRRRSNSC